MNPLFYLAVWIGFAILAIGVLWWVAERSPLLEDEWREHRLETCPIEPLDEVDLLFSSGIVFKDTLAGMWFWSSSGNGEIGHIVAYRLRKGFNND